MGKKISSKSSSSLIIKLAVLALVVLGVWFWLNRKNPPTAQGPNIIQSAAQLSTTLSKTSWMGTASKTSDGTNYTVNVTAFVDKPSAGLFYYVYLKGNGSDLKDMLLGKMVLSGDVFSLNYMTKDNIFVYKNVIVVRESDADATAGKMQTVVLSGSFDK